MVLVCSHPLVKHLHKDRMICDVQVLPKDSKEKF